MVKIKETRDMRGSTITHIKNTPENIGDIVIVDTIKGINMTIVVINVKDTLEIGISGNITDENTVIDIDMVNMNVIETIV